MSIFGAIRMMTNALRADQIALQVAGQNIANANTPGYIREEIQLVPAPTQRMGGLLLGLGVEVSAVVQKIDNFLEERLRLAVADQSSSDTLEQTYLQLEGILSELSETDLSTAMNNFFGSIAEILNQPESASVRNLAVLQGETLTGQIQRMSENVAKVRADVNDRIMSMGDDINRLIEEIRVLNIRIAETEGGSVSKSDAVGLRDQRLVALEELAKLVSIRTVEQDDGTVSVYTGGDYLVIGGISRSVEVVLDSDRGLSIANIHLKETQAMLAPASGELCGLLDSRDTVLGGFLDEFDDFTATLILEFNRLYCSGQGLQGFQDLSSEFHVDDADRPLNQTGLTFAPRNGSFQVLVHNTRTDLTKTTEVVVDLTGLGEDMTLTDLAERLDAIDGLNAEITYDLGLKLTSETEDQEFAFANDTSGILTALGMSTFFAGTTALDIGVNQLVRDNPATFAASRGGIGADTDVAIDLSSFIDRPLASQGDASLSILYDRLTGSTTQGSTVAQAMAEGARTYEISLRAQKLATSGVNLDEETVRMLSFQRAFQASARYIGTLSELLELLVSL